MNARDFIRLAFAFPAAGAAAMLPCSCAGRESPPDAVRAAGLSGCAPKLPAGAKIICAEQKSKSAIVFDASAPDWNRPEARVFTWSADSAPEIRDSDREKFGALTDCKSVGNGSKILISASFGGIALVEFPGGKTLFYRSGAAPAETGRDVNPHSAELLPDGNVAVASSYGKRNIILLSVPENFESPEDVGEFPFPHEFRGAHGVVWDGANKILWAVGLDELAGFEYNFDKKNPAVKKVFSAPMTEGGKPFGGHDLCFAGGTRWLFVTGDRGLRMFDTMTREFRTVETAPNHFKSISMLPEGSGGAVAVLKPSESYWSDAVRLYAKNFPVLGRLDGAKFYKARWFPEPARE